MLLMMFEALLVSQMNEATRRINYKLVILYWTEPCCCSLSISLYLFYLPCLCPYLSFLPLTICISYFSHSLFFLSLPVYVSFSPPSTSLFSIYLLSISLFPLYFSFLPLLSFSLFSLSSLCLTRYLSISLFPLPLSLYLSFPPPSVSLSLFPPSLSFYLPFSLFLFSTSLCLSLSLFLSFLPPPLSVSVSLSLCLFISLFSLPLSVSLPPYLCHSFLPLPFSSSLPSLSIRSNISLSSLRICSFTHITPLSVCLLFLSLFSLTLLFSLYFVPLSFFHPPLSLSLPPPPPRS